MVASKQKHHDHYAERRPSKSQTDQLPVYVLKSKRRKTRKSVAPGDPSGTTLGSLKNDSSGGIINNNSSFQPPPPSETAVKDGSGGGGRGGCCAGCCCSCCKDTGETKDTRYRLQGIVLPFFIRYLARFSHIWEILIYMMVVASFGVVTYVAFFALFEDYLWTFIAVSDVIFNIDVLLRLCVEIWRYWNQVPVVIFTVPYSVNQFVLDLVSVIPFHEIHIWANGIDRLDMLSVIDFYRFNRLLRLYRAYSFSVTLERERRVNERAMFLVRFFHLYIVFIHIVSCILMYLIPVGPIDFLLTRKRDLLSKTWMGVVDKPNNGKYGFPTELPFQVYALATSFSTAVVTTVGYGDLAAANEKEMIATIVFMLIGAIFLNGYFTSQLTTFELELDGARFDLFFRVKEIDKYLKSVKILPIVTAKVDEYYKHLWSYREGVYEVQFMKNLPESFYEDLLFDICQELFDKSFLFNGVELSLLRAVAKIVKVSLYNPQMILCRKSGYANKLYYILQGECRVMSKYCGKPAAILRAGSIIGEANLFFSYPYTTTIETRTCCQLLSLEKEDLIRILNNFRSQLFLLRSKCQQKIVQLYEQHEIFGVEPICWVASKTDWKNPSEPKVSTIRRTMRWGSGINREVCEDVIDDTKDIVIFDTPTYNKKIEKNHLTPYITCTVPQIFDSDMPWVTTWNSGMMMIALFYAFAGPYCFAFGPNSSTSQNFCTAVYYCNFIMIIVYIFDVFVEIISAAPVFGLYYKFWDGLIVKRTSALFYMDVLAMIPFFAFGANRAQGFLNGIDVFIKSMKVMKIIRYLTFMDNKYPLKLFWFRLIQTFLVLMYGIHFIACIFFYLACPEDKEHYKSLKCEEHSWLHSYERSSNRKTVALWKKMDTLRDNNPYLYSFFYSSATLTSAGFGDFNSQRWQEMPWAIAFQLFGFVLIGYYTSTLTSALSCVVRPKLAFQQKLMSVEQFMQENHIKEQLRNRILEYFRLQNQMGGGVSLAKGVHHMLYDTPEYLRDDVLYLEVVDLLEGIPIFSKCDSDVIIAMSSAMKRFVIPPNTTFLHKGEIRRVMYLIKSGSIGIFNDQSAEPINILEASSHFGIRDLLFGEPCHFTMKSMSYVFLYSIKYHQIKHVFPMPMPGEENDFWDPINEEKARIQANIDQMVNIYAQFAKRKSRKQEDRAVAIPSWVRVPKKPAEEYPDPKEPGYREKRKAILINKEYENLFKLIKFGKLWKLLLMKRVVHPAGLFAKVWTCLLSLTSFLTLILMCIETFQSFRRPGFRVLQWILDIFSIMDIYVRIHWGYYNNKSTGNGMLISHPLKTAINYMLNGSFIMDVLGSSPLELIFPLIGWTDIFGYGDSAVWYTKFRWTRILQVKRVPFVITMAHTVFKRRDVVLLTLYVGTTLSLCTLLGSICLFTACPWNAQFWKEGDEYRMPYCLKPNSPKELDYWATISMDTDTLARPISRWVLGVYYVSQVLLVIGFGDLITLRISDLVGLIFMMVFGFIFMRCVIADITAAEVDSDEIRSTYLEQMSTIELVMKRENVSKVLQATVMDHLKYTWKRSKGLHPRDLFADLHLALESDLFSELVGNELAKVPLFRNFPANILRTISGFLKKHYFLKGTRVMRCGNLGSELNIILKGKVYICDVHLNYLCTLSHGDCFGESNVLKGTRRCFNAVAVTNVESYYMTDVGFKMILERYPAMQTEFERALGGGDRDFFEQGLDDTILEAMNLPLADQEQMMSTFAVRNEIIKLCLADKEDLGGKGDSAGPNFFSRKYWIGYGIENDYLPCIYFTKGRYRKKGHVFSILIHPKCAMMRVLESIMSVLCLITPAVAAYQTCFIGGEGRVSKYQKNNSVSSYVNILSQVFEVIFLLYQTLRFITPFEISDGVFCKTYRGILRRYLFSMTFWVDWIGSFSFILDLCIVTPLQATRLKYFFLLRTIRLWHFYENQLTKKYDLSVSTFRFKMTISTTSFCVMAHFLACIFYEISPCRIKDSAIADYCRTADGNPTWTSEFKKAKSLSVDQDFVQWKWWIRSLYWVVTTISTTGFGDIVPITINEMTVAIICIFCGAFILSVILSHFTAGFSSHTRAYREFMYQVQLVVTHLRNIGLSKTRQSQIIMYFSTMWERCRGTSYDKAVQILPPCMRVEVSHALFSKCLSTIPYFSGYEEESLIRQISSRVVHSIFIPGICIVKEGDYGSSMYIVFKGLVSATVLEETINLPTKKGPSKQAKEPYVQLQRVYNVGDVFGRFPALHLEETYKKSYRAETRVEVLEFRQEDILALCEYFPHFKRNLQYLIDMRYAGYGSAENIFTESKQKNKDLLNLDEEIKEAKAENIVPVPSAGSLNEKTKKHKDTSKTGHHSSNRGHHGSGHVHRSSGHSKNHHQQEKK